MKKYFILFLLLFHLLMINNIYSITYYVKTTGNNGTNGISWASAWQTIGHAATNAVAGDVVIVSNGVYDETIIPQNSGTSAAPIIYSAYNTGMAIIDRNHTGTYCVDMNNKSYLRFQGFIMRDTTQNGVYVTGASTNNMFFRNTFTSNSDNGIYFFSDTADNNVIWSNHFNGVGQTYGVTLENADNNLIKQNYIYKHITTGVRIRGSASYNYIKSNIIYSNVAVGISLESVNARYNYFETNVVFGPGQMRGIRINGGIGNIFTNNIVFKNSSMGIDVLGTSYSNQILNNWIFSNNSRGILLGSDSSEWNLIQGNTVGPNPTQLGIQINQGDNNIIDGNNVFGNAYGIEIDNTSISNVIKNNRIYSNSSAGVYLSSDNTDNTSIYSNRIEGRNQLKGIFVNGADNTLIFRNLIINNDENGIIVQNSATNIKIINNTLYNNRDWDAVYFNSCTKNQVINNIIMSNGTDGNDYGIQTLSSSNIYIAYNDIYGNRAGPTNGGGFIWGKGNISADPIIDTSSFFGIILDSSPAVDSGTNYYGETVKGDGIDMGWKEGAMFSMGGGDTSVPTVSVDPDAGYYVTEVEVTLTAHDDESPNNIKIYYTTDGSDPASSATKKTGISSVTVNINTYTVLKYYAENESGAKSEIETKIYQIVILPQEEASVYNNHVDLSKGDPVRIIFGQEDTAEIKIYNMRGVLVKSYPKQSYKVGEGQLWYGTIKESTSKVGAGLYIVIIKGDVIGKKTLKVLVKK